MHTKNYNNGPSCTVWLVLLAVYCLVSCGREVPRPEIRGAIQAAIDSADRAIDTDARMEAVRSYADSVFHRFAPLSRAEKLAKYNFHHWYYTTYLRGDYAQADLIADSALTLFELESFKNRRLEEFGKWMLRKGDALVHLKQLNEAFTYYYQVKAEYLDHWDACKLSQFTTRLGFVRYKQTNYRDAIRYYQQAYAQFCECADSKPIDDYYEAVTEPQGLLNGIAWFYDLLGQPDSASQYYHEALRFLERVSPRFPGNEKAAAIAKGVIYGNLGGLYGKLGRHEEAMNYLRESVAINTKPGYDHRDVQTAQIKLADLLIELGRLADAQRLIADCREGLDSLPNEDFELRWKRVHWRLHDKRGDLPQAYAAFQAYHTFKDSVEASNRALFSADFAREFEQKEQQLAYAQLAYKNKLNFISLVVSIVALVLVLAIVYLIYSNWRRSRRHIKRLNLLNERVNQRNKKLRLALLALQDSHRENNRIMAMVAHDLKNPLANIKMGVEYLLMAQEKGVEIPNPSLLEIIRKSNDRALKLIDELMNSYATLASAEPSEEMDLEAMLRDCVDAMQLRAAKKDQLLVYQGEPAMLRGSREKIWRVISNLLDNAIKFTPRGGQIGVRLRVGADETIVEVSDSGIGIDPDFRDRLFEMGRVAGRTGTDGEPSTGLGLAIVKQIVSAHGGHIHFTSSPESGTTFYVHLPRR